MITKNLVKSGQAESLAVYITRNQKDKENSFNLFPLAQHLWQISNYFLNLAEL